MREREELLLAFRRLVVELDPDFVCAYNGVNFDNHYLDVRASQLGVDEFYFLSRYALRACRLRESKLQSSGMGDNTLRYFAMPGRATFDWYVKLKRDLTQEESYKLDHMALKFCGKSKVELASGLQWKRVPDSAECDPAYELRGCDALRAALASGRALLLHAAAVGGLSSTAEEGEEKGEKKGEKKARRRASDMCEHHWVRAACGARYRPANARHRAIADLCSGTARDRTQLGYYWSRTRTCSTARRRAHDGDRDPAVRVRVRRASSGCTSAGSRCASCRRCCARCAWRRRCRC